MGSAIRSDPPVIVRDPCGDGLVWVNRSFTEQFGYVAEELAKKPLLDWLEPSDQEKLNEAIHSGHGTFQARHHQRDGSWCTLEWTLRQEEQGAVVLGALREESASKSETDTVGLTHSDDTLSEILDSMALLIEDKNPEVKCCVLILDDEGHHVSVGAGPSLSREYNEAIEGLLIGPTVGSCGTGLLLERTNHRRGHPA